MLPDFVNFYVNFMRPYHKGYYQEECNVDVYEYMIVDNYFTIFTSWLLKCKLIIVNLN